jgi:hypothetical protein
VNIPHHLRRIWYYQLIVIALDSWDSHPQSQSNHQKVRTFTVLDIDVDAVTNNNVIFPLVPQLASLKMEKDLLMDDSSTESAKEDDDSNKKLSSIFDDKYATTYITEDGKKRWKCEWCGRDFSQAKYGDC